MAATPDSTTCGCRPLSNPRPMATAVDLPACLSLTHPHAAGSPSPPWPLHPRQDDGGVGQSPLRARIHGGYRHSRLLLCSLLLRADRRIRRRFPVHPAHILVGARHDDDGWLWRCARAAIHTLTPSAVSLHACRQPPRLPPARSHNCFISPRRRTSLELPTGVPTSFELPTHRHVHSASSPWHRSPRSPQWAVSSPCSRCSAASSSSPSPSPSLAQTSRSSLRSRCQLYPLLDHQIPIPSTNTEAFADHLPASGNASLPL